MRLVLWAGAIAAIACGVSCENPLASVVTQDVTQYKGTPPSIDSFTITSGATTYTGVVTFTLASRTLGTGATSITSWQVNESATPPSESSAEWKSFTSPVNGSYTLSSPGTYGARTIYAWLKNDRNLVSTPATQSVQYAQLGGPVIDAFTCTSGLTTYDGIVSFSLGSTHPGAGATSITHWLVNESSTAPLPLDAGWQVFSSSPTSGSYTLSSPGGFGSRTVYAWLKNDHDLVSASSNFFVTYSDYGAPSIDVFALTSATPTDNPAITFDLSTSSYGGGSSSIIAWQVNESATPPTVGDVNWVAGAPGSYDLTVLTPGTHTVYAWAKNNHDKVNTSPRSIAVTINTPTASSSTPPTLTCHDKVVVTFDKVMNTGITPTLGGTMGSESNVAIVWTDSTTLTISKNPGYTWSQGSSRTFTVQGCKTTYGIPCPQFNASFTLFRGTCVSLNSNGGNDANPGTAAQPKETIAGAISAATLLYLIQAGDTAEVRVSKGTYGINWYLNQNKIVMAEGIILKGGYDPNDWGSRSISGQLTTIEDQSTGGGASVTDPNRAISFPAAASITGITVFDGFTIRPGTGSNNAGVYAKSASPTIQNITIVGRAGSSTNELYGMLLDGGSPQISSDIIFSTWEGATMPAYSYGIYTLSETGKHPTIQNNAMISGGKGNTSAIGIYSGGLADVIQNNTVSAGWPANTGTSVGIRCDGGAATISGNSIDAGANLNVAQAFGIQLVYAGAATNPSISGNTFTCSGGATNTTYAIYETTSSASNCDPVTVANNQFAIFFGSGPTLPLGYYFDDGATPIRDLATSITLQSGSGTLASFGNTSF